MTIVNANSECGGCGARVGQRHATDCKAATCWHCRKRRKRCNWSPPDGDAFPFTGDLEPVFALANEHHSGLDIDDFDFWPTYNQAGQMVRLRANRGGPGAWHDIEASKQARDLTDLTFALPHLGEQFMEDCAEALLKSRLLPQLEVLQLGNGGREWDGGWVSELAGDAFDALALMSPIELTPRLRELYFVVDVSDGSPVLRAKFPPGLTKLFVGSTGALQLNVLSNNQSAAGLKSLSLSQGAEGDPVGASFQQDFRSLMNTEVLGGVEELHLSMPEIDDACCATLTASRMVRHLRRLYLWGEGITDTGAKTLANCAEIRSLEELYLGGDAMTKRGYNTLRAAGVNVKEAYD